MDEYTVVKRGRGCYAVLDTNGIEVTRFAFESDARFYARRANAERDAFAQETAATQALVSDLEADGLL